MAMSSDGADLVLWHLSAANDGLSWIKLDLLGTIGDLTDADYRRWRTHLVALAQHNDDYHRAITWLQQAIKLELEDSCNKP